jgi:hypothetical protein
MVKVGVSGEIIDVDDVDVGHPGHKGEGGPIGVEGPMVVSRIVKIAQKQAIGVDKRHIIVRRQVAGVVIRIRRQIRLVEPQQEVSRLGEDPKGR